MRKLTSKIHKTKSTVINNCILKAPITHVHKEFSPLHTLREREYNKNSDISFNNYLGWKLIQHAYTSLILSDEGCQTFH
jgi:hypothetical protein